MIKGIFAGILFFFASVFLLIAAGVKGSPGLGIFIIFLSLFVIFLVEQFGYKGATKEVAVLTKTIANKGSEFSKEVSQEADQRTNKKTKDITELKAYELAGEEIENKNMKMGLWHKAFAEADGHEKKQKALYLKARAEELMQ